MTRYGSGYFGAGLPDEQPIPDRQMTQPTNSIDSELRSKIHMMMLAKSENAKDCGDLTVVPLGFAVDVALQAIKALYVRKEDCKCVKSTAGTVRQNT